MKILLTGSTGFLGKIITRCLQSENEIYSIGRGTDTGAVNHISADLKKIESIELPKVDLIIHAAGKAHIVPKTEREKEDFFEVNFKGTQNLLKALDKNLPKMFVFISTISVYGLDKGELISEEQPLNAVEPYGQSKIMAERVILEWGRRKDVIITILRLPLLAGNNPPGNLGSMITAISSGKYFRIGNGEARKSIVLASDVAAIIPTAAKIGGIFNLTDGYHPSFFEIENAIRGFLNKRRALVLPIGLARVISKGGDLINLILNRRIFPLDTRAYKKITDTLTISDSKARREINWNPKKVIEHLFENE